MDVPFFLLFISVIVFLPVIIIPSIARKKAKQRRMDVSRLLETCEPGNGIPVRYASKAWFEKIWKLFPWEDYGILSIQKDTIVFYSKSNWKIVFPPGQIVLKWIGTYYWPNGVLAWFLIRHEGIDHYFTSDTGEWALKSNDMTKEIVDRVEDVLSLKMKPNSSL